MIRVKVELLSAITGETTELARMEISNVGNHPNHNRGNYVGHSFFGRSKAQLDRRAILKTGHVTNWPRLEKHIWNLVAKMLKEMGYTDWK